MPKKGRYLINRSSRPQEIAVLRGWFCLFCEAPTERRTGLAVIESIEFCL